MRLLTRSDFDGICCAALLKELRVIDEMEYAHPKDLQDGHVKVTSNDVLANVPYVEGCGLWFDHHVSEDERLGAGFKYPGRSEPAPSAARVVYNHYGGDESVKGKLGKFEEMLKYVDKVDSARLTREEILGPSGWVLLGFLCDPRTGLGYHKDFRISNLHLMSDLVDYIRKYPIDKILEIPDVKERVTKYLGDQKVFEQFLKDRSRLDGPVAITDQRGAAEIPTGNRFLIYALFPDANISVRLIEGKDKKTVSFSVGYSILNRTSDVNVGSLMLKYGGGGHKAVGTCQVPAEHADYVLREMVAIIKAWQ